MWPVGWEESRSAALCRTSCPSGVHLVRLRSMRHDSPSTAHDPSHPTGRWYAEPYHQRERGSGLHRMHTPAPIEEEGGPGGRQRQHALFPSPWERGEGRARVVMRPFVFNFRDSRFELRDFSLVPRPSGYKLRIRRRASSICSRSLAVRDPADSRNRLLSTARSWSHTAMTLRPRHSTSMARGGLGMPELDNGITRTVRLAWLIGVAPMRTHGLCFLISEPTVGLRSTQ